MQEEFPQRNDTFNRSTPCVYWDERWLCMAVDPGEVPSNQRCRHELCLSLQPKRPVARTLQITLGPASPLYQRGCQCLQLRWEDEVEVSFCSRKERTKHHESELWEQQSGKLVFSPLQVWCQQITVPLSTEHNMCQIVPLLIECIICPSPVWKFISKTQAWSIYFKKFKKLKIIDALSTSLS